MLNVGDYKLCKTINENTLKKLGFKFGKFRKDVYKDIISFHIHIDPESGQWDYEVISSNIDSLYPGYYNRSLGVNKVVDEIDTEIDRIMDGKEKKKIFKRKRKRGKINGNKL